MGSELYVLLAVAVVGLAAIGTITNPSGAIVGMNCRQVITPMGMGKMECSESFGVAEARPMFPNRGERGWNFVASGEQVGDKFPWKNRVTSEDTNPGIYKDPWTITGSDSRLFSPGDYVNRRRMQREKQNV